MTDYSLLALLHCVFIMCVCVQLQQAWGTPENKRAATKVERAFVWWLVGNPSAPGRKADLSAASMDHSCAALAQFSKFDLSAACVCAFRRKAKRVSVDEVRYTDAERKQNECRNHTSSFPHQLSLHVSLWQVGPQGVSFTALGAVSMHYDNNMFLWWWATVKWTVKIQYPIPCPIKMDDYVLKCF